MPLDVSFKPFAHVNILLRHRLNKFLKDYSLWQEYYHGDTHMIHCTEPSLILWNMDSAPPLSEPVSHLLPLQTTGTGLKLLFCLIISDPSDIHSISDSAFQPHTHTITKETLSAYCVNIFVSQKVPPWIKKEELITNCKGRTRLTKTLNDTNKSSFLFQCLSIQILQTEMYRHALRCFQSILACRGPTQYLKSGEKSTAVCKEYLDFKIISLFPL